MGGGAIYVTLLAQSPVKDFFDGIIAVIREVGDSNMFFVGLALGVVAALFGRRAMKRRGL